jgi:hypothetical protein
MVGISSYMQPNTLTRRSSKEKIMLKVLEKNHERESETN